MDAGKLHSTCQQNNLEISDSVFSLQFSKVDLGVQHFVGVSKISSTSNQGTDVY